MIKHTAIIATYKLPSYIGTVCSYMNIGSTFFYNNHNHFMVHSCGCISWDNHGSQAELIHGTKIHRNIMDAKPMKCLKNFIGFMH